MKDPSFRIQSPEESVSPTVGASAPPPATREGILLTNNSTLQILSLARASATPLADEEAVPSSPHLARQNLSLALRPSAPPPAVQEAGPPTTDPAYQNPPGTWSERASQQPGAYQGSLGGLDSGPFPRHQRSISDPQYFGTSAHQGDSFAGPSSPARIALYSQQEATSVPQRAGFSAQHVNSWAGHNVPSAIQQQPQPRGPVGALQKAGFPAHQGYSFANPSPAVQGALYSQRERVDVSQQVGAFVNQGNGWAGQPSPPLAQCPAVQSQPQPQ
ncbi:hypothetical protein G7Y89_g8752 [Cudoniella acicularis]|uniref:Uncharacterized protein n=1 Tax=Cudoniella acicularis TaxID=354080 RepID=A0A8H4RJP6_9HELO|nr:hypothetical protein G7Y89_g8752 [Cudoniella acicularis]